MSTEAPAAHAGSPAPDGLVPAPASFADFQALDIRVGTVVRCELFPKAKNPAYKLWVDFGPGLGVKQSSAQITQLYRPDDLVGRQVLGVVNFAPRQVADFLSEVLVLGVYTSAGVALIAPERPAQNGDKLG